MILWLMGAKISFVAALATEAWTKMVNILGLFNPGNIGTYEGGTMLVAKMLGLSAAAGLTLGLTRRFRAIFWAAVGGLCLAILSRSKKRGETQDKSEAASDGHVAVVLADNPAWRQQLLVNSSPGWRSPGFAPSDFGRTKGGCDPNRGRRRSGDWANGAARVAEYPSSSWIRRMGSARRSGNDSLRVIGATRWRDSGTSGVDCRR